MELEHLQASSFRIIEERKSEPTDNELHNKMLVAMNSLPEAYKLLYNAGFNNPKQHVETSVGIVFNANNWYVVRYDVNNSCYSVRDRYAHDNAGVYVKCGASPIEAVHQFLKHVEREGGVDQLIKKTYIPYKRQ